MEGCIGRKACIAFLCENVPNLQFLSMCLLRAISLVFEQLLNNHPIFSQHFSVKNH
jgi:hypothetical protein